MLANILHTSNKLQKMKNTKQSTFYLSRSRREILHQLLSQKVGNHSGIFYWQDGGFYITN